MLYPARGPGRGRCLTWDKGQCRRAYHSWQYRLTWMPWPRKSRVHIRTFQNGPVCLSFMVKFSSPRAGGQLQSLNLVCFCLPC